MRRIKTTVVALLFTLAGLAEAKAQLNPRLLVKDFSRLIGNWQGSLTYLDYTSGKPFTMAADLEIKKIGNSNKFVFSNMYPKEPSANSADTITVSADGNYIEKELVTSRKKLTDGRIEIITEEKGNDGNDHKPATFKHTYIISKNSFIKRKEVQFDGETNWVLRNEYSYKR